MLVEVIPILQSNLCIFPNTFHYVGQDPYLTEQPLYVSQHFPLCWSKLSPSYRATSVCFPKLPIMLVEVIPILDSKFCMFPNTSQYVGKLSPAYRATSVCFAKLPIMLVEVITILQSKFCMYPNTSHSVGRSNPLLTEKPLYISQHFPLCWSRLSPSKTATSVCFKHFPLCWSRPSPSYTATFVCFRTLPIMLVEVIPILHSHPCMFPITSHYVGRGYPYFIEKPLYVTKLISLCWSRFSPSKTVNFVCFPTLPIILVEVIPILHSNLCVLPNTSH